MFEYAEHNKWSKEKAAIMQRYDSEAQTLLTSAAARGFNQLPLATLKDVLDLDEVTKRTLTEANGKLYNEQVGVIFQQDEFLLRLAVSYEKLVVAKYIQDLLNILSLEKAEMDEQFKRDMAYVKRLEADVNRRNYDLIIGRADIQSVLIDYETREQEARRLGMDKELELIAAQIETLEEKLRMIPWLQELITKERAIITLERERAVILQAIILLKRQIADVKEEMIPLYLDKTDATNQLSAATTEEVQWKEALIELGFEKVLLSDARADAMISEDVAKAGIETLRLAYTRNANAVTRARSLFDISLTEYGNTISRQVLGLEETLKEAGIDLRLDTAMDKLAINTDDDLALLSARTSNLAAEIESRIAKITTLPGITKKSDNSTYSHTLADSTTFRQIAEAISG